MKYHTIGDAAKITGLSAHTLRYYEKESLITIERKANGIRYFSDTDIETLHIISCLKDTGMSIADIKDYFSLCHKSCGEKASIEIRQQLFLQQKEKLQKKIALLEKHLQTVDYKIWYYENLERFGDESDPNNCAHMREIYQRQQNSE